MNEHFHECPDCGDVWECTAHDCSGSDEYHCKDCWMQLNLIELND